MSIMDDYRDGLAKTVQEHNLLEQEVIVEVKPLTSREAIGSPERDDFPILKGKERIVEARFRGVPGQAFTDAFAEYRGDLAGLLRLDLSDRFNASIFTAAANAVLRWLGKAEGTVHCRDREPGECAQKLLGFIKEKYPGVRKAALVGLQPAMAEVLAGAYDLTIVDLDPDNIGRTRAGAVVQDGRRDMAQALEQCDLIAATGSTLTNNTLDQVRAAAGDRRLFFFGVTISGAAAMLGLERFCPLGH